ncbi:MAG: hypothetical protein ACXWJK_08350 [Burkholderiaceae bacterium]
MPTSPIPPISSHPVDLTLHSPLLSQNAMPNSDHNIEQTGGEQQVLYRRSSNEAMIRSSHRNAVFSSEIDEPTLKALSNATTANESQKPFSKVIDCRPEELLNLGIKTDPLLQKISTSRNLDKENYVCHYSQKHWVFDRYYRDKSSNVRMKHVIKLHVEKAKNGTDVEHLTLKNIVTDGMFDFLERHPELGIRKYEMTSVEFQDFMDNAVNGRSLHGIMESFGKKIVGATLFGCTADLKIEPLNS